MVETQTKTQNGTATKDDVIEDTEVKLSVIETLAWRGFLAQVELVNMQVQEEERKLFGLIEKEHNLPKGCLTTGNLYTLDRSQEQWVLKKK